MKPMIQSAIATFRRVCDVRVTCCFEPPSRVVLSNVCLPGRSVGLSIVLLHSAWLVSLTNKVALYTTLVFQACWACKGFCASLLARRSSLMKCADRNAIYFH